MHGTQVATQVSKQICTYAKAKVLQTHWIHFCLLHIGLQLCEASCAIPWDSYLLKLYAGQMKKPYCSRVGNYSNANRKKNKRRTITITSSEYTVATKSPFLKRAMLQLRFDWVKAQPVYRSSTKKFSQFAVLPSDVVWGRHYHIKVNLELDLELDIHNFCRKVK